jgi:predicted nucleotidyltransferase
MSPAEREILEGFRAALQEKLRLHSLALFGSRARGDAGEDSDMDVLVVVPIRSKEIEDYISDCAWEVAAPQGIVLVPVVFSREEWEDGPERSSLLAQSVRQEGIFL